ncbi:MAG: hypothetical protein ACI4TU_03195 [Candidatus Cryptobacteroides sp.]
MNRSLFVMWMAGMLLLSSCSIKEDRSGCPCWMTVEMPDQVGNDNDLVLRLRGNSDEDAVDYEYQMTEAVRADAGTLEYEVPRGSVGVSAVAFGDEIPGRAGYDGNEIRIPVGEQMDSLYGFFKMYHTRCESVLCDVELHKEFCTVSVTLGDEGYVSPYDIEVWGNVAGVSVWDLMPLDGDFRYAPIPEDGVYRVRVPRQVDNSLELVMLEIPDQVGYDGERIVVDRLPLGEYIARSGYDWAAEDLADVSVALDLEKQQVMITVSDWDGVVVMDIVI